MKRYYYVSEIVVGIICVLIFIGSLYAILFIDLSSMKAGFLAFAGITIGYWGTFFSFFDVRDEEYYNEDFDQEETDQEAQENDLNKDMEDDDNNKI